MASPDGVGSPKTERGALALTSALLVRFGLLCLPFGTYDVAPFELLRDVGLTSLVISTSGRTAWFVAGFKWGSALPTGVADQHLLGNLQALFNLLIPLGLALIWLAIDRRRKH